MWDNWQRYALKSTTSKENVPLNSISLFVQFATEYQQLSYQIRRHSEEIHDLNGNARFEHTPVSLRFLVVFVFDCRSNSDEDFELELFTYIYRHISIYLISMGNAYSTSFNIQVDIRIDILK